jgi:hypothetical protein
VDPSGYFLHKFMSKFMDKFGDLLPAIFLAAVSALPGAVGVTGPALFAVSGVVGFGAGMTAAEGDLRGGIAGVFSAWAFAGVGSAFKDITVGFGSWSQFGAGMAKVVAHGMVGGMSSVIQGGRFYQGFASAGISQLASVGGLYGNVPAEAGLGTYIRNAVSAAIVGGTTSALLGGKFANGAITAAMGRLFNDLGAHGVEQGDPDVGGYSPVSGEYMTDEGLLVELTVTQHQTGFTGLQDAHGNPYSFDYRTGLARPLWSGEAQPLCVLECVVAGAASVRGIVHAGRYFLGPSGSIIGHPAYGGRTISIIRSGPFRFGWGRGGSGPALRLGIKNKKFTFIRLRPPKQ